MFKRFILLIARTVIEHANDHEINEIVKAVIRRYAQRFPEWEVFFLTMPKHDQEERLRTAEQFCSFLKQHPPQA